MEYEGSISPSESLSGIQSIIVHQKVENCLGNVIVYNPDKWGYSQFNFYEEKPDITANKGVTVYEILHISR